MPPTSGQLSLKRSPPLSLVKTTSVFVVDAARDQRLHDPADAFVHVADHAAIGVDVAAVQMEQVVLHLVGERGVVARLPRPVRRGVVHAEEERRRVGRGDALDEVDGAARDEVGEIALLAMLGLALPQVVRAARVAMAEVVDAARHRPEELVVARAQRAERGRIAEVPLAGERRAVAGRLQQRRQRRVLGRQAQRRAASALAVDRLLGGAAQPVLIAAGHQGEARRRAHRRVRVALREADALARHRVEHRRDRNAAAVAAEVGEAEVVGDDEDEVGSAACRCEAYPRRPRARNASASAARERARSASASRASMGAPLGSPPLARSVAARDPKVCA